MRVDSTAMHIKWPTCSLWRGLILVVHLYMILFLSLKRFCRVLTFHSFIREGSFLVFFVNGCWRFCSIAPWCCIASMLSLRWSTIFFLVYTLYFFWVVYRLSISVWMFVWLLFLLCTVSSITFFACGILDTFLRNYGRVFPNHKGYTGMKY